MYSFLSQLLQPFTLLILGLVVFACALWYRRVELRRRLSWLIALTLALTLFCTPAVAYLAIGTLEWRYPPCEVRPDDTDAIVVLSGSILPADAVRPKAVLTCDTLRRCVRAAELYHSNARCPVLLVGGIVDSDRRGPSLAEAMRIMMVQLGVDEDDILIEPQSRSTHENATFAAPILRDHDLIRILLVTDATHLLRSVRCFRSRGIDVVPAGCHYQATEFRWSLLKFLPNLNAARDNQAVFHEWLGLAIYWFQGRL